MSKFLDNSTNIHIEDFDLAVSNKVLLKKTKLCISECVKYGLVAQNGKGKTTLLNYINEKSKGIPKNMNIYMVKQELSTDDKTAFELVIEANTMRNDLLNQIKEMEENLSEENCAEYNDLYEKLNNLNLQKDESKVRSILHGLGIEKSEQDKKIMHFSGGWRMRISLAKALYMEPSLLLLDEPSNHLDLNAVIWLTDYLTNKYKKSLILVSHDKNLLNKICNVIIHIESQQLNYYKGNYDNYEKMVIQNNEKSAKKWKLYEKQLKTLKNNNKLTKEDKANKIKRLCEENEQYKPIKKNKIRFSFDQVEVKGNLLKLENITFGFKDTLFENINLTVDYGDKITLVGNNGVGKSTLFNIITKKIQVNEGYVNINPQIRIGYYNQHSHEALDPEITPIQHLLNQIIKYKSFIVKNHTQSIKNKYNNDGEDDVGEFFCRKCLGDIGLETKAHTQLIKTLSGGQKARIVFASLLVEKPHLILLDEPSNHLDMETIDSMISAINNFGGTIIMITHNIDLIEKTNSTIYELCNKTLTLTDFDTYCDKMLE